MKSIDQQIKDNQLGKETKSSNWGGVREGGGRPKGSTNKISAKAILEEAQRVTGKPLIQTILEGYNETILDGDRRTRVAYEKMLLDKTAATILDVEVEDVGDAVDVKRRAFAEAIQALVESNNQKK
jgi:hypothetical protein